MAKFELGGSERLLWDNECNLIKLPFGVRNGRLYITSERLVLCAHTRAQFIIPIWAILNFFNKPKRIRFQIPLNAIRTVVDGKNYGLNNTIEVIDDKGAKTTIAPNNKLDAATLSEIIQPHRAA